VADDKQRSDQVMDVCRDFLNGRCHRPVCRYYHPSSTTDERFTQAAAGVSEQSADVCKDFLNGRCNRAVCRFYHPPTVGAVVELESHSTVRCVLLELLFVLFWHLTVFLNVPL